MPIFGTCRPPFTFQRMCEILLNPTVYRNADKFFAAFSKVRMHNCLVCYGLFSVTHSYSNAFSCISPLPRVRPSLEYASILTRAPMTRPAWPAHSLNRQTAVSHSPIRRRRCTRLPRHFNRPLHRIFHLNPWTATRTRSINTRRDPRLWAILAIRTLPRPHSRRSCRATRSP